MCWVHFRFLFQKALLLSVFVLVTYQVGCVCGDRRMSIMYIQGHFARGHQVTDLAQGDDRRASAGTQSCSRLMRQEYLLSTAVPCCSLSLSTSSFPKAFSLSDHLWAACHWGNPACSQCVGNMFPCCPSGLFPSILHLVVET